MVISLSVTEPNVKRQITNMQTAGIVYCLSDGPIRPNSDILCKFL